MNTHAIVFRKEAAMLSSNEKGHRSSPFCLRASVGYNVSALLFQIIIQHLSTRQVSKGNIFTFTQRESWVTQSLQKEAVLLHNPQEQKCEERSAEEKTRGNGTLWTQQTWKGAMPRDAPASPQPAAAALPRVRARPTCGVLPASGEASKSSLPILFPRFLQLQILTVSKCDTSGCCVPNATNRAHTQVGVYISVYSHTY